VFDAAILPGGRYEPKHRCVVLHEECDERVAMRVTLASVPRWLVDATSRVSYGLWHDGHRNNTELMRAVYIWLKVAEGR